MEFGVFVSNCYAGTGPNERGDIRELHAVCYATKARKHETELSRAFWFFSIGFSCFRVFVAISRDGGSRRGALRSLRTPLTLRSLRFQLRRALDDLREHRARFAALRGLVRRPDGRRVLRENVLEVAVALDALGRELGDVELAGPIVPMLDEQPRPVAAPSGVAAAGANEHPGAFQLVAVQRELQIALLQRGIDIVDLRRPGAFIPEHDD